MKKVLSLFSVLILLGTVSTQAAKNGYAYFASGGKFGVDKYVKFYYHIRKGNKVVLMDSLPGSYTSAAHVDEAKSLVFLTADKTIAIYSNSNSPKVGKPMDTIHCPGVTSILTYKNWLIVGKGYGSTNGNLSFYSLDSLKEFVPKITPPSGVSDMFLERDSLYLSYGGGFGSPDSTFISTYYLGGKSPIFIKRTYIGSYEWGVSKIHRTLSGNGFIATSSPYAKRRYFIQINPVGKIDTTYSNDLKFSIRINNDNYLISATTDNYLVGYRIDKGFFRDGMKNINFTKAVWNRVDDVYYLISTDYTTPDKVTIVDFVGNIQDSFMVGVSTDAAAVEPTDLVSIENESIKEDKFRIFPNPVFNELFLESKENTSISIFDASGRLYFSQKVNAGVNKIEVNQLPIGVYFIQSSNYKSIFYKN